MAAAEGQKDPPCKAAKSSRLPMQDWVSFPLYLNQATWTAVLQSASSLSALDVVLKQLVLRGMRSPSEHTQAMMSALCIMRDTQDDPSKTKQIPDAMKLRSIYLSVKARVHTSMFKAKQDDVSLPGGKFLTTLPANPVEAPPEVIEKAFPNGLETNQAPFNVMDMANIAREISLRSTNNKVSSKIAMPTPDGFWSTFQAVCVGMMAQHLGRQNSHEECKLLLNQPRSKGLGALLDRVEDNGFQRPAVAPQLALPAPQLALPAPAVAASPSAAPPLATCHRPDLAQTSSQISITCLAAQEKAPACVDALPVPQGTADKQPSREPSRESVEEGMQSPEVQEKVNDQPACNQSISLQQSVQKMLEARGKVKDGSGKCHAVVMKRPSKGPSTPKPQQTASSSKAPTKKRQAVLKKPARATPPSKGKAQSSQCKAKTKTDVSAEERKRLRNAIIASLDLPTKKKFKDGCAKCRYRSLCTLSCWQYRGY